MKKTWLHLSKKRPQGNSPTWSTSKYHSADPAIINGDPFVLQNRQPQSAHHTRSTLRLRSHATACAMPCHALTCPCMHTITSLPRHARVLNLPCLACAAALARVYFWGLFFSFPSMQHASNFPLQLFIMSHQPASGAAGLENPCLTRSPHSVPLTPLLVNNIQLPH